MITDSSLGRGVLFAVPNFSEGRRSDVISAIAEPFSRHRGVKLIDLHPDPDFNRTVVTAIGQPVPLFAALHEMTGAAIARIDMNSQTGSHPRIGAQDTIPVFPLKDISLESCCDFVRNLGVKIHEDYDVPIYFSGDTATSPQRADLAFLRAGQYEGLGAAMTQTDRHPDLGECKPHPTAGAVILSAGTGPLVAYNIILDSNNLDLAKQIAHAVRGPSGGFSTVRAVGMRFEERERVAVSMNLFDHEATPIHRLIELVRLEARRCGVGIEATELVGVVPLAALLDAATFYLQLEGFRREQILEEHLADVLELEGELVSPLPQ
jgi:glutamate formiminotransferase/formiminotetrahydrofolate cyclodeaminase